MVYYIPARPPTRHRVWVSSAARPPSATAGPPVRPSPRPPAPTRPMRNLVWRPNTPSAPPPPESTQTVTTIPPACMRQVPRPIPRTTAPFPSAPRQPAGALYARPLTSRPRASRHLTLDNRTPRLATGTPASTRRPSRNLRLINTPHPRRRPSSAPPRPAIPMLAGRCRELRVGSRIYTVDRTGYKLVRQTTTPTAGSTSTDLQKREFTRTSRRSLIRKTLLGRPLGPPRAPHRRLTTRHCTFYNRFGRCNAGSACPYLHDPARVAICSRFLRGACTDTDCLFSHDLSPERIPLCHHFQHGACDRDNCPYLHIKMAASAPICRSFAYDGFCAQGRDCPQRHVYECPAFHETGECTRPKCKLTHVPARTPRATSGPAARPTPRPPTARLVATPPPKARRYMEALDGLETDETATEQAFDHSAIGTAELSSTVDSNFIPLVESDSEEG